MTLTALIDVLLDIKMYLSTLTLLIFVVLRYYAADGLVLPTKVPAHIAVRNRSFPLELAVSLERRRIFGMIASGVITTVMWPPSRSMADEDKSKVYADEMIMPAESSANTSQSVRMFKRKKKHKFQVYIIYFPTPRRLAKSGIHRINDISVTL